MVNDAVRRINQDHEALDNLFKSMPRCLEGANETSLCDSDACGNATECSRAVRSWLNLLFVFSSDHFARERSVMYGGTVSTEHLNRHDGELPKLWRKGIFLRPDLPELRQGPRAGCCPSGRQAATTSERQTERRRI